MTILHRPPRRAEIPPPPSTGGTRWETEIRRLMAYARALGLDDDTVADLFVPRHGTRYAYRIGCHCTACRDAATRYRRIHRTPQPRHEVVRECRACGIPLHPHTRPPQPGMKRHAGRGLCAADYMKQRRRNRLDRYERYNRPHDETQAEHRLLASEGYTTTQIAERLHLSPSALRTALKKPGHP
jgi:hypothetical protein